MATVRKRTWSNVAGETKTSWVSDYFDQTGTRRLKTFSTKKSADAWLHQTQVAVAAGVHSPESTSITVASAAALWIESAEGLERSTLVQYRSHVVHISRAIGTLKLAKLSAPLVEAFKDQLLATVSRPLAKKILVSLKSILSEAQRRGLVGQNAAVSVKIKSRSREETPVAVGVEIPSKEEINRILNLVPERYRQLLVAAIFTGMRSSELRGLTWENVDFKRKVVCVVQRADQWGNMGAPKSKAGRREIPMSPMLTNTLREWKLVCPKKPSEAEAPATLWLVFPNGQGKIESHANIINRILNPVLIEAGCTVADKKLKDADGKPVLHARFGMHGFRHFFAWWCIEQGFSPKKLQSLMGHSSIKLTYDVYGGLFPSLEDDAEKFAAGEKALFS